MKITKILAAIVMATAVLSCASAAKLPKAAKPAAATKKMHAVYTDWQGAPVGAEIPEWVKAVVSAGSEDEVRKLMGKDDGYRVWSIQAIGEDLDSLKLLTETFDIQTSVAQSIAQNIAAVAKRHAEIEGPASGATVKDQQAAIDMLVSTNVTLRGLERLTSYWTKYYMGDKKGKKLPESKEQYMYIVVMGMSGENFNKQLADSMKKSPENTSEDKFLRKLSDLVVADLVKPAEIAMTASITGAVEMEE